MKAEHQGMLRAGRGFTAVELATAMAAMAVLAVLALVAGSNQRRLGRLGDDIGRLKEIGVASAQYWSDNADRFWTFSWRPGQIYQTQYPDLNNAINDLEAASNQLVYLLRTRANRPDMPVIPSFVPHLNYHTIVLADDLGQRLPWMATVSSGDRSRLKSAADPACFDQGCFSPCQPLPSTPANKRWPYSSSYSVPFAFFDLSPVGSRLNFSTTTGTVLVFATAVLGPQQFSNVSFPSQKVLLHDRIAWHFGPRQPYCTHQEARL